MPDIHKNFAYGTVLTAPSPASSGTSLTLNSGQGASFPTVPFNATVWPVATQPISANAEIVRVTNIAGDVLTITRAQESSSARTVIVGDQVAATITKKTFDDIEGTVSNLAVTRKIGSLTIIGHSYTAGTTQVDSGVSNVWQESLIAKLQALLGIHESNVVHLGSAGSSLVGASRTYAGWRAALQFVLPSNSAPINAAADVVVSDPVSAPAGVGIVVHGCNDLTNETGSSVANNDACAVMNQRGGKNALRAIISRFRAGVVWCSTVVNGTITWPSVTSNEQSSGVVFTGSWSDVAGVTGNSGAAKKSTSTSGDSFAITLPNNFTGGTVAVCLLGSGASVGNLAAAITTTVQTSVTIDAVHQFLASGNLVATIDSEQMLVTAGFGTTGWTVTRGVNGTTAATHLNGAVVTTSQPGTDTALQTTHRVAWTGTSAANGAAKTPLGGQGAIFSVNPVVKRFNLTSADAGKTIIGTMENKVTGDTNALLSFDSWWVESGQPPPVALTNLQDWVFSPIAFHIILQTYIAAWNSMITSLASEFDSWVAIADVYTPWWKRNGTLQSTLNNTDVTTSGVNWTANDSSFTPSVGQAFTFGGLEAGFIVGEAVELTAVSGSFPNWTFTIKRAINGTSKVAHSIGDSLCPQDWMHTDNLHLNARGHAVFAQTIYDALNSLPTPSTYQLAEGQGNWSQYSQLWSMGMADNQYLYPPCSGLTTGALTQAKQYAVPIWISRNCIVVEMGLAVTTGGSAGSVVRLGIYSSEGSRIKPGRLIQDFGTIASTGISDATLKSGIYQVLRPGWYWLAVVPQVSVGPTARVYSALALPYPTLYSDATLAATSVLGFSRTGIDGISGTANAAVTTNNTTLTDTRVAWATNIWAGAVVTCNGKTMTVVSNTGTILTGASWSGGGNPGNGNAYTVAGAGNTNNTTGALTDWPASFTLETASGIVPRPFIRVRVNEF